MRISLTLAAVLLAAHAAAQDADTSPGSVDPATPAQPSAPPAAEPAPVITEPPPRFVPREKISPDRVIAFPADI